MRSSVAPLAFARTVFGASHRYGTAATGSEATLKAITAAQMRAFHTARYKPSNATLIVAGDVTAATVLPLASSGCAVGERQVDTN